MKINIVTIFPELYTNFMNEAMIKKAIDKNLISFNIIDFRQYTVNKHKKVDDYVYGHGAGMLLTPQPIAEALKVNGLIGTHIINPSPRGEVFSQVKARKLSLEKEITFITGRYEGIDQRIIDKYVDEEVSIGDYILTGGEIPSQVMIEAIIRLIPGVLNTEESFEKESFEDFLLEEDQYTRPYEFEGMKVPDVLISGDHKKIDEWKLNKKISITKERRSDLYEKYIESKKDL